MVIDNRIWRRIHQLLTHRWRHPSSTKGFLRCVLHSVCPHPVCMLANPKKSAPRTFSVFPDRGCRLPRLVVEARLGPSIVFALFFWKFRSAPPRWPRNSTRSRRSADRCYYPRLAGRVDIAALFNQFGMDCDEVVFSAGKRKFVRLPEVWALPEQTVIGEHFECAVSCNP